MPCQRLNPCQFAGEMVLLAIISTRSNLNPIIMAALMAVMIPDRIDIFLRIDFAIVKPSTIGNMAYSQWQGHKNSLH